MYIYIHMCVHVVSGVQSLSCVWLFATPWTEAHHSLLSSTIPQVCLNSCQLSRWCYLTISLSATQFFCLPSFSASDSFPMSQFFTSGGQSIGASTSATAFQWIFRVGLISLQTKRLVRVFSSITVWKHQFFNAQPSLSSNSHIHTWLLEKP